MARKVFFLQLVLTTLPSFAIRHDKWFIPFGWIGGLSRRRSTVTVGPEAVRVRMGWAFRADIAPGSIVEARRDGRRVSGWGVHGFGGHWLVNGSSHGIVVLELAPEGRCSVLVLPLRLRELRISLVAPEEFLAALHAARP